MKAIAAFTCAFLGLSSACATGTVAVGDGGIVFNNGDDATPGKHDGGTTCSGTMCSGVCVDLANDPNNCGGCGVPCDASSVCSGSQCVPVTASNEPPVGICAHSLCTSGSYLDEGCDDVACTVVICDYAYLGDTYCCDTAWDSECIAEVDTYCAPYSCQ